MSLTQAQFEAGDWTYAASITTADNMTEVVTVPDATVTVQHAPRLQITLDNSSCTFSTAGEACSLRIQCCRKKTSALHCLIVS